MKKILALVLAFVMVFALAACGDSKAPAEQEKEEIIIENPESILNSVWDAFGEDMQFPAMGGDMDHMADNAAAEFSLADSELVLSFLHISEETASMSDKAASLMHAMNANTFTSAAFHLAEGADAANFAEALKNDILSTQWMCGFPETLVVYTLGEYVVYALGNGEIIDCFKTSMSSVYGENAVLSFEEAIG